MWERYDFGHIASESERFFLAKKRVREISKWLVKFKSLQKEKPDVLFSSLASSSLPGLETPFGITAIGEVELGRDGTVVWPGRKGRDHSSGP